MTPEDFTQIVRNRAAEAGASDWLDALPGLVADLEREWGVTVGRRLDGGTEAFVAEAVLEDGTEAVMKLLIPRDGGEARNEIIALQLSDGSGCARLLRHDLARSAMLLERLGTPMCDLGLLLAERLEHLAAAASRVWRPAAGCGLPTGAEKGRWLIDFITTQWEALGRPCSERAIDYALGCAESRIAEHDDDRAVLVHGDVHQWNALRSNDGFKLVDPDGLLAEPEYDLGVLMREDPVELMQGDPRARARRLAGLTGLDATAIWEWGAVERVSTGLVCAQVDLQPEGQQMLAAADHVSA